MNIKIRYPSNIIPHFSIVNELNGYMDWKWQYILNVYKCYDCNTEYTSEHENHMYLILWWPDITIYVNVLHWTICLQIISNVIFWLKVVFFNEMWHFENIPYANCNVRKTYWHNFLVPCFQYCTDKSYGTQVILPFWHCFWL